VRGIAGIVLVAEKPADHRRFLSAFSGARELEATAGAIAASTPRGDITVMDRPAFHARFAAGPPDISQGARLAAMRFNVSDRSALTAALNEGGIAFSTSESAIVVTPETALGAAMIFEQLDSHG
jgi:hypothetical protein